MRAATLCFELRKRRNVDMAIRKRSVIPEMNIDFTGSSSKELYIVPQPDVLPYYNLATSDSVAHTAYACLAPFSQKRKS